MIFIELLQSHQKMMTWCFNTNLAYMKKMSKILYISNIILLRTGKLIGFGFNPATGRDVSIRAKSGNCCDKKQLFPNILVA